MAGMVVQELGTERKGDIREKRSVTHAVFLLFVVNHIRSLVNQPRH
jgi:hypothetical protein